MKFCAALLAIFLFAACAAKQPTALLQAKVEQASGLGNLNTTDFVFAATAKRQFRFEVLQPITMQTIFACGSDGKKAWWWENGKNRQLSVRQLTRAFEKRTQLKLDEFLLQLLSNTPTAQLRIREWTPRVLDPQVFSAYE